VICLMIERKLSKMTPILSGESVGVIRFEQKEMDVNVDLIRC